jgi:hypothetical protein
MLLDVVLNMFASKVLVPARGFRLHAGEIHVADVACPVFRTPAAPPTGKVFPLAQWAEAVTHSQQEARGGKVLLACS